MMRKMLVTLAIVALVPAMLFAAAGEGETAVADTGPRMGGVLDIALWQGIQTLDWQSSTAHPVPHAMTSVFEGLYALGADMSPQPELAEGHTVSDDARTWTFTLRRGVRFHNGQEMTSADVKASLERWLAVSPRSGQLSTLSTITAPDAYTVQLQFEKPIGTFLLFVLGYDSAKAIVMPESIAKASPEGGNLSEVVGTGPYMFAEYQPDNFLRVERFDDYVARSDPPNYQTGRKTAYVDETIYWIVPEASTRVAGLETGEYDLIERVPDTEFTRLQDESGVDPLKIDPPVFSLVFFNNGGEMFADMDMRRAVQAAVNAEAVARSKVADPALSAFYASIMPQGTAYYSEAGAEFYNQDDPAKARQHLQAAGYNGEPIRFLLLTPEETIKRAVITLAEQLKAAGMNIKVESYDLGTWVAKRRDPTAYELFVTEGVQPDPLLWQTVVGGRWPGEGVAYSDPEIDELMVQMAEEVDLDRRFGLAEQFQRLIYEKAAFLPVGWHFRIRAKRSVLVDPEGVLGLNAILAVHNVYLNE